MKQQCHLAAIYLNWLVLVGGFGCLLFTRHYGFAIAALIALPLGMSIYIRVFPSISQAMGYGKVEDKSAQSSEASGVPRNTTAVKVTLYTALGCPFCPIVERRLQALRDSMNLEIETIDVTVRPDLLAAKHIRAVPVVEIEERRVEGNATTEQLTQLILGKPALVG